MHNEKGYGKREYVCADVCCNVFTNVLEREAETQRGKERGAKWGAWEGELIDGHDRRDMSHAEPVT